MIPLEGHCQSQLCKKQAMFRLWCPTWITANEGPRNLCSDCAKAFQVAHNPMAAGGSWHWGDNADKAFKQIKQYIPCHDPRFHNVCGLVKIAGTHLRDHVSGAGSVYLMYVVDENVWIIMSYAIINLGRLNEAKDIFPELLKGVT